MQVLDFESLVSGLNQIHEFVGLFPHVGVLSHTEGESPIPSSSWLDGIAIPNQSVRSTLGVPTS